jgi:hypothetical protein
VIYEDKDEKFAAFSSPGILGVRSSPAEKARVNLVKCSTRADSAQAIPINISNGHHRAQRLLPSSVQPPAVCSSI